MYKFSVRFFTSMNNLRTGKRAKRKAKNDCKLKLALLLFVVVPFLASKLGCIASYNFPILF